MTTTATSSRIDTQQQRFETFYTVASKEPKLKADRHAMDDLTYEYMDTKVTTGEVAYDTDGCLVTRLITTDGEYGYFKWVGTRDAGSQVWVRLG